MKHSTRAALWSALVLPGVGQIVLQRYARGFALLLATCAAMGWIVVKAAEQALAILGRLEVAGGPITGQTLADITTQASTAASSPAFNIALYLIVLCWIFGVVDAYRLGRRKDAGERPAKTNLPGERDEPPTLPR